MTLFINVSISLQEKKMCLPLNAIALIASGIFCASALVILCQTPRAQKPPPHRPIRFKNAFSLSMRTPSVCARSAFDPGSEPTTT